MILVDSSAWIDYFRGAVTAQTDKLDALLGHEPLAIGDLILTEMLQGFANEGEFNRASDMLTSFMVVELGGQGVAIQAAEISVAAQSRRNGSQDHRYRDCNQMHRERVLPSTERQGL